MRPVNSSLRFSIRMIYIQLYRPLHIYSTYQVNSSRLRWFEPNLSDYLAAGQDGRQPLLMKSLAPVIADLLASLFNKFLKTGETSIDSKTVLVTQIYKKGSKHDITNYRPVSLVTISCKVTQRFVQDSMQVHIVQNHFVNDAHYGFVSNRSPWTSTSCAQHDRFSRLTPDKTLRSSFGSLESVRHFQNPILLTKLEVLEASPMLCKCVAAFLMENVQRGWLNDQLYTQLLVASVIFWVCITIVTPRAES